MAIYFLDTNAIVKYYILEPGSTWVRNLIDLKSPTETRHTHTIFIADISAAEVAAAFAILYRTNRIRRSTWDRVFDEFVADMKSRYRLIATGRTTFFDAMLLTRRHPLKSYDAIQLAVANRHAQLLSSHQLSMTFVSGDRTLLTAAQAEGLTTDNPFDHIVLQDTSPEPRPGPID